MTNFDTECTSAPVCPYCGHKDRDWWEWLGNQEDGEQTCGSCEREYRFSARVHVDFTTSKAEGEDAAL